MRQLLAPIELGSIPGHPLSLYQPALPVAGGACIVERASAYGPSVGPVQSQWHAPQPPLDSEYY